MSKGEISLSIYKYMRNDFFFSSGSYGCTHYPHMKCNGKQNKFKNGNGGRLISKLTAYDFVARNEYEVGQKLKLTNQMKDNPIVLVEHKCEIKKKGVKNITKKYEECRKIVSKKRALRYVLFYSKYFKSITASEYLRKKINFKRIFDLYSFSIKAIKILNDNNVVHMDFHLANLIYDENNKFHLIDFGLALDLETIDCRRLQKRLHSHNPERSHLPIELHILTYLVFNRKRINEVILTDIVDTYYDKAFSANFFKDAVGEFRSYKFSVYFFLKNKYVNNRPIEKHMMDIIRNAAHTWDAYRISYYLIKILGKIDKDTNTDNLKNDMMKSLRYDYASRPTASSILNDPHMKMGNPL